MHERDSVLRRDGRWLVPLGPFLASGNAPTATDAEHSALTTAAEWAVEFLTNPHPDLGLDRQVCPFTKPSIQIHAFYLSACSATSLEEITTAMRGYRVWFRDLSPTREPESQLKTIVVVMTGVPNNEAGQLLDNAQELLKNNFVEEGLMVGQFHPDCEEPGVRNPAFRPLKAPIPLLAIRNMVPGDGRFMTGSAHHLAAYLARFIDRIPSEIEPVIDEAIGNMRGRDLAAQLLAAAKLKQAA